MERLLSVVTMADQAGAVVGGESLLGSIKIAVLPIAKVFTMCFLGFLMASKYVNILPAHGRKLLNGVRVGVPIITCMPVGTTLQIILTTLPFCHAVGLFTFTSVLDILSTWSSYHLRENAPVVTIIISVP